jgi:hypothetical protein
MLKNYPFVTLAFQIEIGAWIFVMLTSLIALITVSYRSKQPLPIQLRLGVANR